MKFIEISNLSYDYKLIDEESGQYIFHTALEGLDLSIEKGQFVGILGHNGSGKSTLAKHLNALYKPKNGKVLIDGIQTDDDEKLWEIRQRVGMVFQNPDNQIIGYTVEEDVAFGLENLGIESSEMHQRVREALERVNMWEHRQKSPNKLSGGQKQRVAIAGVLAMHPECIVFDESTAMLDPSGRKEVLETIKELKAEGLTIILITHYMDEVIDADRVIVMDKGHVALEGSPAEVFSQVDSIKELGLELPQVCKLAGTLQAAGVDIKGTILKKEELINELLRIKKEKSDN